MRRMAVWSAKGGSGKTTVALNLAAAFARRGRRVLLMDLDPQSCLLRAFGAEATESLLPIVTGAARLTECVRPTEYAGLHLVAASPDLDTEEQLHALGPGAEQLLDESLEALDPQEWDLLLLDCPPGINRLSVSALVAAREHLAPVEPAALCAGTLAATLDLADAVRRRPKGELAPTRILLTRIDRSRPAPATVRELRQSHGDALLETAIPGFSDGSDVSARLDPVLGHSVRDPALRAFDALARELLRPRARSGAKPPDIGLEAPQPYPFAGRWEP